MRVEATKVENGLLIPFNQIRKKVEQEKVLLDIEFIDPHQIEAGYAILEELVGINASTRSDASVNHDAIIYELKLKP